MSLLRFILPSVARALLLGLLTLFLGGLHAVALVTETDTTFTAEHGRFYVELSKTGGKVLRMGYRADTSAPWTHYHVSISGLAGDASASTNSIIPSIHWVELEEHLIVRYAIRQSGLYWNFWFHFDPSADHLYAYRFIYGENKPLVLTGAGVQFVAPGFTATTGKENYTVDTVTYTGGYLDLQKEGTGGLRVLISDMDQQSWQTQGESHVLWYRRASTNFGTKIDYKRFVIVPYALGSSLQEYDRFMRQYPFDHSLTNVELVSTWVVRTKNRKGEVRDWFNASNHENGFTPGTGSSYVDKSGFWRDDWTTGGIMRQLRDSYWITGNPYYFMRMVDITDYQMDRDNVRLKSQWGARNTWQENYLMGRLEVLMDIYEMTGWEFYKVAAFNSLDWFEEEENWRADGAYLPEDHNYIDMSYNFEGMYRTSEATNWKWKSNIDGWYAYIEKAIWDPAKTLYKHRLGKDEPWSRGHGWWMETFSNIIVYYGGSNKQVLIDRYKAISERLYALQDGIWHRTIDDPKTFLDASGGTMIAAGFANSFMKGDLDERALKSAMDAIAYVHKNLLMSDGTIIGTDRGNAHPDPFPYTQEGYVKFAHVLGISEVLSVSERDHLYTTFDEGVFIVDENGGELTDVSGAKVVLDGAMIIAEHKVVDPSLKTLRLMGVGQRSITLKGAGAPGAVYSVRNVNSAKGVDQRFKVTATTSGDIVLAINLSGDHLLTLSGEVAESWADWGDNDVDGWVDTGSYLGYIFLYDTSWIFPIDLGNWIFFPEANVGEEGGWSFMPRH